MNTKFKSPGLILSFITITAVIISCNKNQSASTDSSTTASSTITVASTNADSTGTQDSVDIVQPCAHGYFRDSVSEASLPAAITTYLTTNYSGYTFAKAFSVQNSSGTVSGYVEIIYYNEKPVGILFDSSGNFVQVLQQRKKNHAN